MSEEVLFHGQRISTEIDGLDELLFGGQYLHCPNLHKNIQQSLSIAIYGDRGTSKSLFAMQLLHGITKSIHQLTFKDKTTNAKLNILDPFFIQTIKIQKT